MPIIAILLAHGSRAKNCSDAIYAIADMVKDMEKVDVEVAFLKFEKPTFFDVLEKVRTEFRDVVVIPYFLFPGVHIRKDIPELIIAAKRRFPELNIKLGRHLGIHRKIAEIVLERVHEVVSDESV